MTVNTNVLQYSSEFSGFKNLPDVPFSVSYAGGTIASGGYVGAIRASTVLSNANQVSQIQVMQSGLETFYRLLPGTYEVNYPNNTSAQYQIEAFSYFKSGSLYCDFWIINQTAGSITVPAIVFECSASLFVAPF